MTNPPVRIPFNKPALVGTELENISQAIANGVISGGGSFANRCELLLQEILHGSKAVLLTTSCTHALEMCAMLLDLGAEDEVIVPSFTFVSTALAFSNRGCRVVFADIDPRTLNISPESVEQLITPRTKAVVAVHYGGLACEMNRLMEICSSRGIHLIEDAAHALGGSYQGRPLGTLGTFSTLSFHETKNVTCGEGGALVINDEHYIDRAHIIRDKGTNRRNFQKGSVPFYTWVDYGSSYVISDLLAAFLLAQLERLDLILEKRRELIKLYEEGLVSLKDRISYSSDLSSPSSGAHLFYILCRSSKEREELRQYMNCRGILAIFHYQPLHLSPYAEKRWSCQQSLPIVEDIAPRLLRLPLHLELEKTSLLEIVTAIGVFFSIFQDGASLEST